MNEPHQPAPRYPALTENLLGRARRAKAHWRTPGAESIGMTSARVRLKGYAKPIDLASAHLCHFDPDLRATEARRLTTSADTSRSALVGMDANSYPHRTDLESAALPDWDEVEDRLHYQHVRAVSDHALLLARFDLDVLRRALTPTR